MSETNSEKVRAQLQQLEQLKKLQRQRKRQSDREERLSRLRDSFQEFDPQEITASDISQQPRPKFESTKVQVSPEKLSEFAEPRTDPPTKSFADFETTIAGPQTSFLDLAEKQAPTTGATPSIDILGLDLDSDLYNKFLPVIMTSNKLNVTEIETDSQLILSLTTPDGKSTISRVLRVEPDKQNEAKGYFELRSRNMSTLIANRNRIRILAKKNTFEDYEKEELRDALKTAKSQQAIIKNYENKILNLVDIESVEDFQDLMDTQNKVINPTVEFGTLKLKKIFADDLEESKSKGEKDKADETRAELTSFYDDPSKTIAEAITASQRSKVTENQLKGIVWNGENRKYKRFKEDCYQIFGKYDSIDYVQKFIYLKQVMPSKYHTEIERFNNTADGYKLVWEYLDRRYGREKDQVQAQEDQLKNLPIVYKNKANSYNDDVFSEHIARAKIALQELAKLGRTGRDNHIQWITWMTPRVDTDLAAPFLEQYEIHNHWDDQPSVNPMDKYLEYLERKQLAYHDQRANKIVANETRSRVNKDLQHGGRGHAAGRGRGRGGRGGRGRGRGGFTPPVFQNYAVAAEVSSQPLEKCCFCGKKNHASSRCRSKGDPKKAFGKVYEAKGCVICLNGLHKSPECPQRKPCGVQGCKIFHHPQLHGCQFVPWVEWFKSKQREQSRQQQRPTGNANATGPATAGNDHGNQADGQAGPGSSRQQ